MPLQSNQGIYLDVEPSILENNLRFAGDANEQELNRLFQDASNEHMPSKIIKPSPGFCLKTKEVGSDNKFFVNICHTDGIPSPRDITENELRSILESDEAGNYRIPMSIGEIRSENDKKGEEARVCDIAINPQFFRKIENSQLFKNFFLTIVFEALNNKYGLVCHDEKIVLRNRKTFGNLQTHRIQDREMKEKMKAMGHEPKLIQEVKEGEKPKIETIASFENPTRQPEYRLYRKKNQPNTLIGEFKFPDIISAKDLILDIGEDRILIESQTKNYLLDIFFPYIVKQSSCTSNFNKTTKILTVIMPLVGG